MRTRALMLCRVIRSSRSVVLSLSNSGRCPMSVSRTTFVLAFSSLFSISLLSSVVAQSPQSLRCGTATGNGTNRECDACTAANHCKHDFFNRPQRYRVCEAAGTGCTNGSEGFCTGFQMTGTPTDPCGGTEVLDGSGDSVVCQSVSFKTCVP